MTTSNDKTQMMQRQTDAWAAHDKKMLELINSMEGDKRTYFLQRHEAMRNHRLRCFAATDDNMTATELTNSFAEPLDAERIQSASAMSWFDATYVSPTGNDNNPGTQAAPFRTIQRAIDTGAWYIQLEDGVYAGFTIHIPDLISVIGNPNRPEAVVIDGNGAGTVISSKHGYWLDLQGMTITGGGKTGNQIVIDVEGCLGLLNSIVTGNSSNRAIISGTIEIGLGATLIYGNHVDTNSGLGIIFAPDRSSFHLNNITIADNIAPAAIQNDSWININNSILYNPLSGAEIKNTTDTSFLEILFSNVRNYATLVGSSIWIYLAAMMDVDPRFVSPEHGMYQLADDSPCIDAGSPWGWDAHLPPAKGTSRSDMGAYGGTLVASQPYQTLLEFTGSAQYSYDASGNRITRELV